MANKIQDRIFNFDHYREFLKNYILNQPRRGWGTLQSWSKALKVNSTYLSQILKERKDLSLEQAYTLGEHLGLSKPELHFFILLVEKERAGSKTLRKLFEEKIKETQGLQRKVEKIVPAENKLSEEELSIYYSSWVYAAIRNFSAIGEGFSFESLQARFPQISKIQLEKSIAFLLKVQLCVKNQKNLISIGQVNLTIPRSSPQFQKQHYNWRVRSMDHLEGLKETDVMLTLPMSISRSGFTKISNRLMDLLKEVVIEVNESPAEDIACLNLDFFWID